MRPPWLPKPSARLTPPAAAFVYATQVRPDGSFELRGTAEFDDVCTALGLGNARGSGYAGGGGGSAGGGGESSSDKDKYREFGTISGFLCDQVRTMDNRTKFSLFLPMRCPSPLDPFYSIISPSSSGCSGCSGVRRPAVPPLRSPGRRERFPWTAMCSSRTAGPSR